MARHTRNRTRLENIELKARAAHRPFKQRRARSKANHHRLKKFKQRAISEKSASRLPIADIRQAAACFRDGVVPACAALIAATERSTADQSPLISPPAAGLLHDATGSYMPVLFTVIGACLVASALLLVLSLRERARAASTDALLEGPDTVLGEKPAMS